MNSQHQILDRDKLADVLELLYNKVVDGHDILSEYIILKRIYYHGIMPSKMFKSTLSENLLNILNYCVK